jgi:hypothetical protein
MNIIKIIKIISLILLGLVLSACKEDTVPEPTIVKYENIERLKLKNIPNFKLQGMESLILLLTKDDITVNLRVNKDINNYDRDGDITLSFIHNKLNYQVYNFKYFLEKLSFIPDDVISKEQSMRSAIEQLSLQINAYLIDTLNNELEFFIENPSILNATLPFLLETPKYSYIIKIDQVIVDKYKKVYLKYLDHIKSPIVHKNEINTEEIVAYIEEHTKMFTKNNVCYNIMPNDFIKIFLKSTYMIKHNKVEYREIPCK